MFYLIPGLRLKYRKAQGQRRKTFLDTERYYVDCGFIIKLSRDSLAYCIREGVSRYVSRPITT
jgi:hypothetical protein